MTEAIVTSSDMMKNYKACREKAERFGKIYVFKNNQLDAILLSLNEYEKVTILLERLEG